MADRPISAPLPADLPENWANGQIVSPDGSSVGLSARHGYNYLMEQVNAAQEAANDLNAAFDGLASSMELSALSEAVSQQAQDIEDLQDAVSGGGVDLGGLRGDLDSLESTVSSHTGNSSIHVTSTDKQNWNSKAPGSLSATVSGLSDDLDSLESTVSGHTGNSSIHVTSSDKSNWNSKAPGSLSTTVSNHTGNSDIHVTSTDKEKWDGYSTIHTLSYYKSGVTHYLTGLSGLSGTVSCVFKATAAFNAGDTIRVDNTGYTIQLSNGEDPEDNLFVSGATVAVIVDKGNYRVNFKSGGGLSNSKLALANATAADVAEGKTFYAGNKTLKTGTLVPYKYATGTVRMPLNDNPQVGDTVLTISGLSFRPFLLVVRSYEGAQNYPLWDRFLTCVNEPDSDTTLTGFLVNLDLVAGYDDATWPVAMTTQQGAATVRITEDWGAQEIYPANCYYYAVGL